MIFGSRKIILVVIIIIIIIVSTCSWVQQFFIFHILFISVKPVCHEAVKKQKC